MPSPRKYAMSTKIPREWSPQAAEIIEKEFERIYKATQLAGSDNATITNGIDVLSPAVGDLIVGLAGNVFGLTPIVATAQRSLTNNGGIPTWAQVSLATGVTGLLPLANIANFSATKLLWGRNSAGAGVAEEVTLSQLLDWITAGTVAQGDIIYRNATTWVRLAAGTIGQFLGTNGAAANPSWQSVGGTVAAAAGIPVAFYVTAGGAYTQDGPYGASAGTITATTNAKPAAAFTDGFYWHAATANTAGSAASYVPSTSGTGPFNFTWDFDISLVMRTDIQDMLSCRYWVVVGAASAPGNVDTLGANGIGFRFSTAAGDGGWVGITNDGTQAVTATVAAIAANTRYLLRIRKVGSTVFFSVNGGTEVSQTLHVPVNDAYQNFVCACYNTVTAAGNEKSFYFSRAWGTVGS